MIPALGALAAVCLSLFLYFFFRARRLESVVRQKESEALDLRASVEAELTRYHQEAEAGLSEARRVLAQEKPRPSKSPSKRGCITRPKPSAFMTKQCLLWQKEISSLNPFAASRRWPRRKRRFGIL